MPNDGLVWDLSTSPSQGLQGHSCPQGFHWLHPILQSPGRCVAWFAWAWQGAVPCEDITSTSFQTKMVHPKCCRKQDLNSELCYICGSSVKPFFLAMFPDLKGLSTRGNILILHLGVPPSEIGESVLVNRH